MQLKEAGSKVVTTKVGMDRTLFPTRFLNLVQRITSNQIVIQHHLKMMTLVNRNALRVVSSRVVSSRVVSSSSS